MSFNKRNVVRIMLLIIIFNKKYKKSNEIRINSFYKYTNTII